MKHKVKILDGDDWVKVYVDGECIHQGHDFKHHSYAFEDFAKKIGFDLEVKFGMFDEYDTEKFIENE